MRLVERMTQNPPRCLYCGKGNTTARDDELDTDLLPLPYLDLEREVNWGDSTYLCGPCVLKAAALYGYITPEQALTLEQTITSLRRERHDLRAMLQERTRRLDSIVKGREALQAERKARRTA